MKSTIEELGTVNFQPWSGERIYMMEFTPDTTPEKHARMIEDMTRGIEYRLGYLTLDETIVKSGHMQRRGGLHIDGNWTSGWRHGGWEGKVSCHGRHTPRPGHISSGGEQLLVLAATEIGCAAFVGEWEDAGEFNGGDRGYVDRSTLKEVLTRPGVAYIGGACSMLHESVPVTRDTRRTFARLNLVTN